MLCQIVPGKQGLLAHHYLQASKAAEVHLGVIQLQAKMISSKKDLERKITEDTSGKHKRGRQGNVPKNTHRQNGNIALLPQHFYI